MTGCNAQVAWCVAPIPLSVFGVRVARICLHLLHIEQEFKNKKTCSEVQWLRSPAIGLSTESNADGVDVDALFRHLGEEMIGVRR